MSKQFTVITKDGSKWLRPVNPFDPRDIMWQEFNLKEPDLLYLGNHPEGTTVDESEVKEVRQGFCEYTMKWITEYDDDLPTYNRYRTVYTDAESHSHHTSEDYWRKRCEAAENYINESPCDPDITKTQNAAYEAWQEIVKQQPK